LTRINRRVLNLAVLVAVLAVGLAGCSKATSPPPPPLTEASKANAEAFLRELAPLNREQGSELMRSHPEEVRAVMSDPRLTLEFDQIRGKQLSRQ
jgi:hypothetical protein